MGVRVGEKQQQQYWWRWWWHLGITGLTDQCLFLWYSTYNDGLIPLDKPIELMS